MMTHLPVRLSAALAVGAAALTLVPPAVADPLDPIPGDGVFQVGADIEPGLYHTGGPGSRLRVWIAGSLTQESMCSWFTYSTPEASKDRVVQANTSIGPTYVSIPATVKAFESQNCQPWTRVSDPQ